MDIWKGSNGRVSTLRSLSRLITELGDPAALTPRLTPFAPTDEPTHYPDAQLHIDNIGPATDDPRPTPQCTSVRNPTGSVPHRRPRRPRLPSLGGKKAALALTTCMRSFTCGTAMLDTRRKALHLRPPSAPFPFVLGPPVACSPVPGDFMLVLTCSPDPLSRFDGDSILGSGVGEEIFHQHTDSECVPRVTFCMETRPGQRENVRTPREEPCSEARAATQSSWMCELRSKTSA